MSPTRPVRELPDRPVRLRWLLAALTLVAAGALAWLLVAPGRGARDRGPTPPAAAAAAAATRAAHAPPPARASTLDPEPAGPLRLEGQVIDHDERPVGGALVTVSSEPPRTAVTEADGSFAFDGLMPRTYRVGARRDALRAEPVSVRLRADTEPLILRARPGNTLVVTVVDADTGAPIAGARLDEREQRAVTDAAGVATLRGVASWFVAIHADADGYAPALHSGVLPDDPGGEIAWTVPLARGAAITGRVVDPAGAPVAGAVVSLAGGDVGLTADTGADGTWRVPGAAAGRYEVVAEARGLAPSAPVVVEHDGHAPPPPVTLRLVAGARVAGIVVDEAGAPVAGARVITTHGPTAGRATTTGADGRFVLAGLAPAAHTLSGEVDDRASPSLDVTPPAADVRLVVAPATISGTVVDAAGAPVPDARVAATGASRGIVDAVADAGGRFVLGPVPPGDYRLEASRPGANLVDGDLRPPRDDAEVRAAAGARDVVVTLPATGAITAVVTRDGQPVPHFGFTIDHFVGGLLSFATPAVVRSADGRLTRDGVPAGTWFIAVFGDGFARTIVRDIEVVAGRTTDLGAIAVEPGRTIAGRVVDAGGAPVAGAEVVVARLIQLADPGSIEHPLDAAKRGSHATTTSADGTFAIPHVADANLRAVALHPRHGRTPEVTVPDDAAVVLAFEPTGAIHGALTTGDGSDPLDLVVGVEAVPAADPDATPRVARLDPAGQFRIDAVVPGRYRVRAVALRDASAPEVEVEVTAGATATADLALGHVTLAVERGARACRAITLSPGDAPAPPPDHAVAACTGDVTFRALTPGPHHLCVDDACRTITVAEAPARQAVDVSAW